VNDGPREIADTSTYLRINVEGRSVVLLGSGGRPAELDLLTEAEEAVALLAVEGLTNAEIASRRGRSNKTVANQLASIYRKLGVKSREQLVRLLSDISAV